MTKYNLIRGIIGLIIFLCVIVAVILINKHFTVKQKRKRYIIILFAVWLVSLLIMLYPIENLVFNFETPEAVFNYMRTGTIDLRIDNNSSSLIVYKDDDSSSYKEFLVPKNSNGYYEISKDIHPKEVLSNFEKINIDGFDYKNYCNLCVVNNSDYYLIGFCYHDNNKTPSITDSLNSEIKTFDDSFEDIGYKTYYYAKVDRTTAILDQIDDYYVTINGKDFHLE